jgi:hypothetical protein
VGKQGGVGGSKGTRIKPMVMPKRGGCTVTDVNDNDGPIGGKFITYNFLEIGQRGGGSFREDRIILQEPVTPRNN